MYQPEKPPGLFGTPCDLGSVAPSPPRHDRSKLPNHPLPTPVSPVNIYIPPPPAGPPAPRAGLQGAAAHRGGRPLPLHVPLPPQDPRLPVPHGRATARMRERGRGGPWWSEQWGHQSPAVQSHQRERGVRGPGPRQDRGQPAPSQSPPVSVGVPTGARGPYTILNSLPEERWSTLNRGGGIYTTYKVCRGVGGAGGGRGCNRRAADIQHPRLDARTVNDDIIDVLAGWSRGFALKPNQGA